MTTSNTGVSHWLDEEDGGEELIRFELPAQPTHYGTVRGTVGLLSRYTDWEVTALGVATVPRMPAYTTQGGTKIGEWNHFHDETLELVRGVVTVACCELERIAVWHTRLLVPRRQVLGFCIRGGPRTSGFVLRFAWKRHEGK